ncbi:MAG: putative PEP-binding protein [Myxococcales bacterium]|nr:putative PEP-binding protein [Myxococcales bacterium]
MSVGFRNERGSSFTTGTRHAITTCLRKKKTIGLCGQGPSDHLDFAQWLMAEGLESMSLNPDTVVDTWKRLALPPRAP